MNYSTLAVLIITGLLSQLSFANEEVSNWGKWAETMNFNDSNNNTKNNTKNNAQPNVVYGTGITGRDENLLHELDQSSLLDYDKTDDITPVEFGPFPQGQDISTQPNDDIPFNMEGLAPLAFDEALE